MRYGRIHYLDTEAEAEYSWQAIRGYSRVVHVYDGPKLDLVRAGQAEIEYHKGNGGYIWRCDA
jgi:hypothetical protein